ncbi:4Fe-4S binding protein [Thauera sp. CAU 1555]|uniref:4Fe-4S binding protein n=1 Tax=Thauera sedimentorum TaxID=2767595 RepID=A0ABR9BC95_9RHOO|nr:4Fe-4S binding protein [Thauera sedimentorum]MBC9073021.1 4Fe-4S binding protein [Thauera sedimentorum]MBD8503940.1 4Fe-4S binding protein [Thauera sedimentorum]
MSLVINDLCVGCYACEPLCPNKAISAPVEKGRPVFFINPDKCTECLGDHDLPQCSEICPIEGAIVDEFGEPLNPPGSLTGIPLHLLDRVQCLASGSL